ncbi:serine/threonine protein kinase [Profundibacter amoris]|uniref:non-specific serine/threonine protein kinase n=2 Tax=Profundibacter amoris TaxID=2171755 RepID=A0A347UKV4_9RHOB|nr:serine/threonine protein kinase [Profundibacter amoris]
MGQQMVSTVKQIDQIIEQGGEDDFVDELKPGTELLHGQYVIEEFLNSGGFGITYLAKDSLDRRVVIKECFPNTLCRRSYARVGARSRAHQAEFKSVIDLFVQEAKSLAKLDHPNIVGVHQVFEDNDTAYMALDYIEGFDLLETLEDGGERLPPAEINKILRKILGAVDYLHGQNILHRDISPDNILIDKKTSEPLLIDFGAAREEVSKASRVLSALRVVKDGYSPQEFYVNGSKQGPSSDLYALAASFYHLITGDMPTDSQTRLAALASDEDDPYVPLTGRIEGYDEAFLAAIDKALKVLPKDRIQTAKEWMEMISGGVSELPTASKSAAVSAKTKEDEPTKSGSKKLLMTTAIILVTAGGGYAVWKGMAPAPAEIVSSATEESVAAPTSGNEVEPAVDAPVIASVADSEELIAIDTPEAVVAIADTPEVTTDVVVDSPIAETPKVTSDVVVNTVIVDTPEVVEDVAVDIPVLDTPEDVADIIDNAPVVDVPEVSAVEVVDAPVVDTPEVAEDAAADTPALDIPEVVTEIVADTAQTPEITPEVAIETPVVVADAAMDTPVADAPDIVADIVQDAPVSDTPEVIADVVADTPVEEPLDVAIEVAADTPVIDIPQVVAEEVADAPEVIADTTIADSTEAVVAVVEDTPVADTPEAVSDVVAALETSTDVEPIAEITPVSIETEVAVDQPAEPVNIETVGTLGFLPVKSAYLPFSESADQPGIVARIGEDAPTWVQVGQQITAVNGVPIDSFAQINPTLRSMENLGDLDSVQAEFTINGTEDPQSANLAVVSGLVLPAGLELQMREIPDGTVRPIAITSQQAENSIMAGDVILTYLDTGEKIGVDISLDELLLREINKGDTKLNFIIDRGGKKWIAPIQLTDNN